MPRSETLGNALPGLTIALVISSIAYLVSSLHPSFDALVISVIFGMLVMNMFDDCGAMDAGIDLALKVCLPVGIALYGLQLRLTEIHVPYLPAIAAVFVFMFGVTFFIARGFGLSRRLSVLLGTGMSVCGASAVVIISPIVGAKKEETSISILTLIIVGLTGMLMYRFLPDLLALSVAKFAFLTGTTLPMLGQVKVAAAAMGEESLRIALGYKLIRLSALAVVVVVALVFSGARDRTVNLPWFMVVFFALAVSVNLSDAVAGWAVAIKPVGKFFLTTALSAVGMSISFDSVTEDGINPMLAVFLAWGIIVMAVYLALSMVS